MKNKFLILIATSPIIGAVGVAFFGTFLFFKTINNDFEHIDLARLNVVGFMLVFLMQIYASNLKTKDK